MLSLTAFQNLRRLALLLLLCGSGICPGQSKSLPSLALRLHGEVHRPQKFEKEIGQGLVLRLAPSDYGWNIEVGPKDNDEDYIRCVNGPFHGITPYQIEGWLFRNDDNTAPRGPSELLTPAIGQKREFHFVLTAEDQKKSCADLDKMLYIYDENNPEHLAAANRFGMYAGGDGSLTITSMTLGNLKPGEQAWIETMQFEATFTFRNGQVEKPAH